MKTKKNQKTAATVRLIPAPKVYEVEYVCTVKGSYYVRAHDAEQAAKFVAEEKDPDELYQLCTDGSSFPGNVEVVVALETKHKRTDADIDITV